MRNGAEDMEHQLPCRRGRINAFLQADQIDFPCLEGINGFQQFFERPSQAIEPDDRECIVGTRLIE